MLEQLFGVPFPRARPTWLVNPRTGRRLEFDGFNAELRLAFEYHGEHHYSVVLPFKMDRKRLNAQQQRDTLKATLCAERGIKLIEVPHTVNPLEMPGWIFNAVRKLKDRRLTRRMKDWREVRPAEWLDSDSYSLADLQRTAEARGGSCLSDVYLGAREKHQWQCRHGHVWSAAWDSINNQDTWCPVCAGTTIDPTRIDIARKVAAERGGRCLSAEYLGADRKLRWRCAAGHEWDAVYYSVVTGGSWCRRCADMAPKKARSRQTK